MRSQAIPAELIHDDVKCNLSLWISFPIFRNRNGYHTAKVTQIGSCRELSYIRHDAAKYEAG
jgi:hypothetical protein